ncbi:phage major capsid protein [Parabacteroides pacaensis]|uniref:phage major capsid protein n=1 Tax=Parabacteroides pacaensis TaxID=2086575 RepID=UPI000D10A5D1|nr:phage major capsid protein [Parabacteroides pacaensis]
MNKQKRKMIARIMEINTRFKEIADALETEKRSMSPQETEERNALQQEKEILQLRLDRIDNGWSQNERESNEERAFAEAVTAIYRGVTTPEECEAFVRDRVIDVPVTRAAAIQDTSTVTPLIPMTIGEIIEPLEKGLILSKVGCKMQYGLVGEWVLPVVAGIEATIEEENAEVADTTIDISQLKPSPKRCALAIPVSNRAIDQSNTALLEIVRKQLTMGLTRLLNKWMFTPEKITSKASEGCFVAATSVPAIEYDPAGITWKDVIKLKGKVMKTGVVFDSTAAYVCSATTYAELEATPRDAGSGRMILENGQINGFPVFMTEFIGDNILGFGIFNYELVGQFGKMRITVDPYTGAKKNLVYFVLNTDFDMLTVRPEAFGVAKPATQAGN